MLSKTRSPLRSENVIRNSWTRKLDVPLVSIFCTSYNHGHYIASAIESFLQQITEFPIEILIHDDASTDKTPQIIQKYEVKYPSIIKPIYQKTNQLSKGIKINAKFNYPRSRGIYVALCEGDDYWSDPFKLQIQVNHMESSPETSLCVHASKVVKSSTGKVVRTIRPSDFSRYFDTDEIIEGGGGLFATNSMLFRRPSQLQRPSYFDKSNVGDYPLMIYLSTIGKVYYLDRYLSVYRTAIRGSWTSTTHSGTIQKMLDQKNNSVQLLHEIDQFYERRYASAIQRKIRKIEFEILHLKGEIGRIGSKEFADLYGSLGLPKKILLLITRSYYPQVYAVLKRTANFYNQVIESFFIKLDSRHESTK
jgi:glycosyltransferase involved in cell wall biosynthesis